MAKNVRCIYQHPFLFVKKQQSDHKKEKRNSNIDPKKQRNNNLLTKNKKKKKNNFIRQKKKTISTLLWGQWPSSHIKAVFFISSHIKALSRGWFINREGRDIDLIYSN